MLWLNYHHLYYFWVLAREGRLSKASAELSLAQSTVSKQLHQFQEVLGQQLLVKRGRRLVLTEAGQVAFRYADSIFGLGRDLLHALSHEATGRRVRVAVGVADAVPKLTAQRALEGVLLGSPGVRLVCREGRPERLLADLATGELDLVLSDSPGSALLRVKAHSHLLGQSSTTFYAVAEMARRYRSGFPDSLAGAPMLLPTESSQLRRSIDEWLSNQGLQPDIVGEFDDSALLHAFGFRGLGLFPAPTALSEELRRQYSVEPVGQVVDVTESLFATTLEKNVSDPSIQAIFAAARSSLGPPKEA